MIAANSPKLTERDLDAHQADRAAAMQRLHDAIDDNMRHGAAELADMGTESLYWQCNLPLGRRDAPLGAESGRAARRVALALPALAAIAALLMALAGCGGGDPDAGEGGREATPCTGSGCIPREAAQ